MVFDEGLEMRIILKFSNESGIILFNHKSMSMIRRISNTLIRMHLKNRGNMPSKPAEGDVWEDVVINSS